MKNRLFLSAFLFAAAFSAFSQHTQVQNQLLSDTKWLHFGFVLGMNYQDFEVKHTNALDDDGNQYYMEVPTYRPGFTVGVISDLKLLECLDLRFVPTLNFGDRSLIFVNQNADEAPKSQILKSTVLNFPLYIKYRAERHNNYRPYLIVGSGITWDLAREKGELILLKPMDVTVEFGVGCDFYLPYFKLAPELKLCLGLLDMLERDRSDLYIIADQKYTRAISKLTSRMIVLTFNFE
ncbi:hypothetical protein FACS189434_04800 [Bacteroidia bacterium]|nr:hypothetical protein FACS189434_04800 [Bacteroidia bacterium]